MNDVMCLYFIMYKPIRTQCFSPGIMRGNGVLSLVKMREASVTATAFCNYLMCYLLVASALFWSITPLKFFSADKFASSKKLTMSVVSSSIRDLPSLNKTRIVCRTKSWDCGNTAFSQLRWSLARSKTCSSEINNKTYKVANPDFHRFFITFLHKIYAFHKLWLSLPGPRRGSWGVRREAVAVAHLCDRREEGWIRSVGPGVRLLIQIKESNDRRTTTLAFSSSSDA